MDNREFPDIEFVNADTQTILNELIADYETATGRKLYPADPVRVLLLYEASVISQERVIMNSAAKQNLPRFAVGKYLDSLAEIFQGITRLDAAYAKTTLEFEIFEPQESIVLIPKGTRVSADGIIFATDKECVIEIGATTIQAEATCETPGTAGNGFLEGQINACVDIFPYFKAVKNITESEGGADVETDSELYERMRGSVDSYSAAGSAGAYAYYAKSASSLIGDVAVSSPLPGEVDIRVLCKDGTPPSSELLNIVYEIVSADTVRPLTDKVTVSAPDSVIFDVDVRFFVMNGSGVSLEAAQKDIEAAVEEYVSWQSSKIGRDIVPSRLNQMLMITGIKRVEIISPKFYPVGDNETAQLGSKNIVCGGYEDE